MSEYTREEVIEMVKHGESLFGAALNGIDLSETTLEKANFSGVDMGGANLSGANLNGINFTSADLSGVDLSGSQLRNAHMGGVDLSGADLCGADLSDVQLSGADMCKASLNSADISRGDLSGANMAGADMSGANLNEASLCRAYLSWVDLSGVNLASANLGGANLENTCLIGACLRDADLSGTSMIMADLGGADLNNACLIGVDLSNANLVRANLQRAYMVDTNVRDADLRWADLRGVTLQGIDLSASCLYQAKFCEEDLGGVKYRPEQLDQIILESSVKREGRILVPDNKSSLDISFKCEEIPLRNVIHFTEFLEHQYDSFYFFLFTQDKNPCELEELLGAVPYHKLKKRNDAIRVTGFSGGSRFKITGVSAVLTVLFASCASKEIPEEIPDGITTDIYKRIVAVFGQSKKNKLILDEKCSANNTKKDALQIFEKQKKSWLTDFMENTDEEEIFSEHEECYLNTILLLRRNGLLTNNLKNIELVPLFKKLVDKCFFEYQALKHQLVDLKLEINE